ncbi:MAG TPA: hypothetical protein VGD84_20465 [Pseudonocardiaceae bacterium]
MRGSTIRYDAHGGWYDAGADWGKHFTQLSDASYFNTLSIPLTAWVLFAAHDELITRADTNLTSLVTWLLDEAMFGADYLARVHKPGETFYSTVVQPQADDLTFDLTRRTLSPHQVCYREGAGLATSWRFLRWAGGIVNGITGLSEDGRGLAWDPGTAITGPETDWRWLEQWLPHSTWYLYAVSIR